MPDLPFLDSFDHYLSADAYQKWTSVNGMTIGAVGRRGTNGAILEGLGAFKTFDNEYGLIYCGAAVLGAGQSIFSLYNLISGVNITLQTVGDGRLKVSGTDPTVGGNFTIGASLPILSNAWHYIEMKASVSSAGVSVEIHINEEIVITGTYAYGNPNVLILSGHAAWATVQIFGAGGGLNTYMDDFYATTSGFYGDVNIDVIRPDGPATSNWIPNPNVANWNNVKDITPDGDATTVSSANVNDLDLYTMQDIPSTAVVKAIQGIASVKKDTAGLAALKLQYGSGGGAVFSVEYYPSELSYEMLRDGREDITDPTTINALVFGELRTK